MLVLFVFVVTCRRPDERYLQFSRCSQLPDGSTQPTHSVARESWIKAMSLGLPLVATVSRGTKDPAASSTPSSSTRGDAASAERGRTRASHVRASCEATATGA